MDEQQIKKLVNTVECYQIFKTVFAQFRELSAKTVPNEGPFKSFSVKDSKDLTIEFETPFDSKILGRFSLVSDHKGKYFGRITFEQVIKDNENRQFWEVFFDKHGNAGDSWPEVEKKHYLANEQDVKDFLLELLYKYLVVFKLTESKG